MKKFIVCALFFTTAFVLQSQSADDVKQQITYHYNTGMKYYNQGDYKNAELSFLKAKNIHENTLGKEHWEYATILGNLGTVYKLLGDYIKAEAYYLEAKNIREQTLGKDHTAYAQSLGYLGNLYRGLGDYAKAEMYLLEAKNIREKTLGKEHPDYGTTLLDLGNLYTDFGDYSKAEIYYIEAKNIREKTLGKEHPSYALVLNNLGHLYDVSHNYSKAESYYLEAKNIREKTLGREHPDYAITLNNLGALYSQLRKYDKAITYYLEAKTIKENTLGKEHSSYATLLNNIGFLYHSINDYSNAEIFYSEAKAIREKTLGREHPDYEVSIANLSDIYISQKNYTKAEIFNEEKCSLAINMTNRNFAFMTEEQRTLYWKTQSNTFETSYSLAWINPAQKMSALNYNNALFSKGLLLRTTNAVRDAIYSSNNTELIERFERLRSLREQISALKQKESPDQNRIKTLEAEADSMDKYLTQRSAEFRDLKIDIALGWQDVQKKLKADEVAIEFVSFNLYEPKWTNKIMYAALVLRPKTKTPVWVPLCEETQLQDILSKASGRSSDQQARIIYDVFGTQIYDIVWEPLEKELKGVKTIYYAPSGLLHKIAYNAIPADDTKRLADKYNLNLVSSTREIIHFANNNNTQLNDAVLYGGLKYNSSIQEMKTTAQKYKNTNMPPVSMFPAGLTRGGAWVELPAAREEIENVKTYLDGNHISNILYQDNQGIEESFKDLNGKHTGLIHLATHGFFLADIEQPHNGDESPQPQRGQADASRQEELKPQDNPLLRSGLLLSGGNNAWTNKKIEGVEDGILTADEIARLNLLGVKLVILSACQTGLGDVKNGEGVFGLQRAFKLAGVESLVMSLWEVDDSATSKLMSTFYTEWLSGKSKQESFKEAQRQVRAEYSAPFYWAAFVMMD